MSRQRLARILAKEGRNQTLAQEALGILDPLFRHAREKRWHLDPITAFELGEIGWDIQRVFGRRYDIKLVSAENPLVGVPNTTFIGGISFAEIFQGKPISEEVADILWSILDQGTDPNLACKVGAYQHIDSAYPNGFCDLENEGSLYSRITKEVDDTILGQEGFSHIMAATFCPALADAMEDRVGNIVNIPEELAAFAALGNRRMVRRLELFVRLLTRTIPFGLPNKDTWIFIVK